MSFLTRTTPRLAASRVAFAPRAFSTSFVNRKSPVETVKEAAKVVDRAVSDKLVGGIEAGGLFFFPSLTYIFQFLSSPTTENNGLSFQKEPMLTSMSQKQRTLHKRSRKSQACRPAR